MLQVAARQQAAARTALLCAAEHLDARRNQLGGSALISENLHPALACCRWLPLLHALRCCVLLSTLMRAASWSCC
jgi:hypothetical protein